MDTLTPDELAGEVWAEINMCCWHGPIEGFDHIDTEKIKKLDDADHEVIGSLTQLIGAVLDRHIGAVIVADEGRTPDPLPRRILGDQS